MLGAQNPKAKHPLNTTPPKLQRIPKSDSNADTQMRNVQKISRSIMNKKSTPIVEKKEGSWYTHSRNELLHSSDGSMPKPAQNIALMAGKKYIVVPKNNAMAVQPAVTSKTDKIGDKPPFLRDSSPTEVSNTNENSLPKGSNAKLNRDQDRFKNDDEMDFMSTDDVETEQKSINDSSLTDSGESEGTRQDVGSRRNSKTMSLMKMYHAKKLEQSESGNRDREQTQNYVSSKASEASRIRDK